MFYLYSFHFVFVNIFLEIECAPVCVKEILKKELAQKVVLNLLRALL